jgi:hypothetical protein
VANDEKVREAEWIIDALIFEARRKFKEFPRSVVELPVLRDELRKRNIALIIKNERNRLFTLVVVERNAIRIDVKTEEEFLRFLLDMISERLGTAM